MKRACVLLFGAFSAGVTGCADVTDKASDLTTISVGAGELDAVQVERTMTLGPGPIPACLDISLTLPSSNTTVAMQSTDDGCTLRVTQPGLVLFDQQEIERARDQLGPFDIDGIRSGSVTLNELELSGGDGTALALSQYVDDVSVQVDDQMLLDRTRTADIESDDKLTRQLPGPLMDKLKASVANDRPATADVSVTMWLHGPTLTDLPGSLTMSLVLQPQLEVSLLKAL